VLAVPSSRTGDFARGVRDLVHFDGSGSGMRFRDAALAVGDVLTDAG
jgi:hypothetical protein